MYSIKIMFNRMRAAGSFASGFFVVFMLCLPAPSHAMLLNLPAVPLFLGRTVPPNVFLMVDDSGSMDWEILRRPGTFGVLPEGGGFFNSGNLDITPTRNDRDEIFESCAGYNATYYNPNNTYTPWVGVDAFGNTFTDQSITAARFDPRFSNVRLNLTGTDGLGDPVGYMTWNDADNDGDFDIGECPDTDAANYNYDQMFTSVAEMSAAERTNFANWYTYYRKREFVLKRAVTPLVRDFDMRMGLATLHNNNNVGIPIRDLTEGNNRNALLNRVVNIDSNFRTPLRTALRSVGRYYEDQLATSDGLGFAEDSPILDSQDGGMCQQNFTMLMSDGFWNGEDDPGVGNADGDGNTEFDKRSYGDGFSETLADVAMHYYERDLAAAENMENKVPISEARDDTNPAQHMVTYTVSFGLSGTLNAAPQNFDDSFPWPEPFADEPTTADDMLHAAWNGRGQFLNASDPEELIDALSSVLNDIEARGGTAASAAANGGSISTESRVFQAQFDSRDWSGRLLSFEVKNDGTLSGSPEWDAAVELNDKTPSQRNIVTYDPVAEDGQNFLWGQLTTQQKQQLDINPDSGSDDGLGELRVDFIRGDLNAAPVFRQRSSRLGDLINSDPEFVGAPRFFFNFAGYQDFFVANRSRQPVVYVGGNDGMLHAFDAVNGEELFGYIPGEVFPRLNSLTDPGYTHQFYADGSPIHADIQLPSGGSGVDAWRTILAGGLRSGGQGVYALDITNPASFSGDDVLFEFTDEHDADLGFTYADPLIVRTNRNADPEDPASGDWAVIFGNGYNNSLDDGRRGSGEAVLFIVFVDAANGGISNGDFIKITTGTGDLNDPNGMGSAGAADINGDGRVDYIYAGDLRGNLWKFDLNDDSSSGWGLASNQALFEASDSNGNAQAITAKPVALPHPLGIGQGALIAVGSGKFLESKDIDPELQETQTFYAIWDRDASPFIDDSTSGITRSSLAKTTISTSGGQRLISSPADPEWLSDEGEPVDLGWYLDLTEINGERIVRPALARSGVIFFVTLIPSMDVCEPGGRGFLMALNSATGGIPGPEQTTNGTVFDTNGDGVFDLDDNSGEDVVIGLEQEGIPAVPAVIFDPRPFCERNPEADICQEDDDDGDGDDGSSGILFPPPLNSFRGCGSEGTRIYLYTTTSNGNISTATASLGTISCGRQAWRQLR